MRVLPNKAQRPNESPLHIRSVCARARIFIYTHLSQCGLSLEKIRILAALGWIELRVQECTAIGYGLQGGGAFIRKGQTYKQLRKKYIKEKVQDRNNLTITFIHAVSHNFSPQDLQGH